MKLNHHLPRLSALCGSLLLTVTSVMAQPANDNFVNARTLVGANVTTNGNSQQSSKETGEPNHANNLGGRSVWFNWTAPGSGSVRVDTVGSSFNTLLGVYTGTAVNALTLVASNNDAPGLGNLSRVQFEASQGTIYRIAVDANRTFQQFPPNGGNYVLNIATLTSVNITSPTEGTIFTAGQPVPVSATATVPSPPVARVDFYRGGTAFASSATAPYQVVATNLPAGSNALFAVAVDNAGLSWTSPL